MAKTAEGRDVSDGHIVADLAAALSPGIGVFIAVHRGARGRPAERFQRTMATLLGLRCHRGINIVSTIDRQGVVYQGIA